MDRPVATLAHDDGVDRWTFVSAAPAVVGWADRYGWWTERTQTFTARRELAATTGVLIVNLGSPLEIVDAAGTTHRLSAGQGFAGGIAQATSLSRAAGEMSGVHIHLSTTRLARLLGLPLGELTDRCADLATLLGHEAAQLGEQLQTARDHEARWQVLDGFIAARAAVAPPADREVEHARARLAAGHRVEHIAADLGWSRKRLARRFADAVGLHPRAYAGVARFERFARALQSRPDVALAGAALDAGYADQPHLTRAVRRYADLTPGELRARLIPAGGGVRE